MGGPAVHRWFGVWPLAASLSKVSYLELSFGLRPLACATRHAVIERL